MTKVNTGGDAQGDVLTSIDSLSGSKFDCKLLIFGGSGNDKLIGGAAADVFIFANVFGSDTITDFWAGATRTDRIWLMNTGCDDFGDVLANATNSAAGAVIHIADRGDITLTGISVAQLHADDFIFG